jgi:preprotein translocase subunit Sec61beta
MAKQEQAQMPSGQGGLVQYFDSDSGFDIDPKTVIGLCVGVAVVEIALQTGIFTV